MFKKILSVVLVTVLFCGTILSAPALAQEGDTTLRFAVASDIHYVTPLPHTTDLVKDVMGPHRFNTASGEKTAPSGFVIDAFLNQCAEDENCNFVLIAGDLATYGRTFAGEHEAVAEKLRAFEQATGKQVYVINGNHDNGSADAFDHNDFVNNYHEFGYDEAFDTDEGTCSYSVLLNDKYMLIALDSFDEGFALASKVDAHRLSWVRKQAAYAKKTGREPILMLHHHIMEHDPFQAINSASYIIKTPYTTSGLLADMGIRLVFSGHFHMNDVTSYTSLLGNTIYDFALPSLCDYPAEYKTVSVNGKEVNYRTEKVQRIDADALNEVCKGFSASDLALMKTDFSRYITEREYRNLAGGIADTFRMDTSNKLLSAVSDNLVAMLDVPLYGEDSLQQQAAQYGIAIPDSNFQSLRDFVVRIYMNHASGRKVFNAGSTELDVLVKSFAFAIHKSSADAMDSAWFREAKADKALQAFSKTFGALTVAEHGAVYIASDLFGKYIGEQDGIDNCSGTLTLGKLRISSVLMTVLYVLRRLVEIPVRALFKK